jgi:hypothetical protein
VSVDLDMTVPQGSARGAWANGYSARLSGASRYANPYAEKVDELRAAGDRPGWLNVYAAAWWSGWHVADALIPSGVGSL